MKSSNSQQNPPLRFKPRPLTGEQETALEALLEGKNDREAAEIAGVSRWSVQQWKTSHPVFMATLEQRRADLWRAAQQRLLSLLSKAVQNLAEGVEAGLYDSSIEVIKLCGLYRTGLPAVGETDSERIITHLAEAQVQREGIAADATHAMLVDMTKNQAYTRRLQEITEELYDEYGEPDASA
jgi:hypothetical protein